MSRRLRPHHIAFWFSLALVVVGCLCLWRADVMPTYPIITAYLQQPERRGEHIFIPGTLQEQLYSSFLGRLLVYKSYELKLAFRQRLVTICKRLFEDGGPPTQTLRCQGANPRVKDLDRQLEEEGLQLIRRLLPQRNAQAPSGACCFLLAQPLNFVRLHRHSLE